MNKYIDSEKLIVEIDRKLAEFGPDGIFANQLVWNEYNYMRGFVDRLPAETASPELRAEVVKFNSDHFAELHSDMETIDIVHIIARHFAEWGSKHLKK